MIPHIIHYMEILSLIKMNQKIMTIIEIVNKILKNFFIFSHISTYIKKSRRQSIIGQKMTRVGVWGLPPDYKL